MRNQLPAKYINQSINSSTDIMVHIYVYCCTHDAYVPLYSYIMSILLMLGTCTRLSMSSFGGLVPKFGCDLSQRISNASWCRLILRRIVDHRKKHKILGYRSAFPLTGPLRVYASRTVAPLEAFKQNRHCCAAQAFKS